MRECILALLLSCGARSEIAGEPLEDASVLDVTSQHEGSSQDTSDSEQAYQECGADGGGADILCPASWDCIVVKHGFNWSVQCCPPNTPIGDPSCKYH